MPKKENNLWVIVWYDDNNDEEEWDEEGNLIEDHSKYIPYRISCAYLDLTYSNWKYVTFPNRAGKMGSWKRSEWWGKPMPLDHVFEDMRSYQKAVEGMKVEDLVDITSFLAEDDIKSLRGDISRHTEDLDKILKWQKKEETHGQE